MRQMDDKRNEDSPAPPSAAPSQASDAPPSSPAPSSTSGATGGGSAASMTDLYGHLTHSEHPLTLRDAEAAGVIEPGAAAADAARRRAARAAGGVAGVSSPRPTRANLSASVAPPADPHHATSSGSTTPAPPVAAAGLGVRVHIPGTDYNAQVGVSNPTTPAYAQPTADDRRRAQDAAENANPVPGDHREAPIDPVTHALHTTLHRREGAAPAAADAAATHDEHPHR